MQTHYNDRLTNKITIDICIVYCKLLTHISLVVIIIFQLKTIEEKRNSYGIFVHTYAYTLIPVNFNC